MKTNRLIKIILTLAILSLLAVSDLVLAQGEWVIDRDKVSVDDENIYLSATPHTLSSSGWVEFELLSKKYEGNIDAVWGFNTADNVILRKPQIWDENAPHTKYRNISVNKTDEITIYDIIGFQVLQPGETESDIGNEFNSKLVKLTIAGSANLTIPESTLIIAFNSHDQLSTTTATFYYTYTDTETEEYIEYYPDWRKLQANLSISHHSYKGMDNWQFVRLDTSIVKDKLYKVRVWVEIPFAGLGNIKGKYFWGVKPSGETIREAIQSGHAYFIDPWWNSNWSRRRLLTIDNSASAVNLINFPILVKLDNSNIDYSRTQDLGQDIRFVDADNITVLDHEIEKWDEAGISWVWVEIPQIDAGSVVDHFWMYYGNAGAGDGQDMEGTWEADFMLVDHLQDDPNTSSTKDSTSNNNDGTKKGAGEPAVTTSGQIDDAQSFDGTDDLIDSGDTPSVSAVSPFSVEAWIKPPNEDSTKYPGFVSKDDGVGGHREWCFGTHATGDRVNVYLFSSNAANYLTATGTTDVYDGNWHYVVATWDGVNDAGHIKLWVDSVEEVLTIDHKEGTGYTPHDTSTPVEIGRYYASNTYCWTGVIDEVRISSVKRSDDWIEASHLSEIDSLITFGAEESTAVPPTVVTNTAQSVEETTTTLSANVTIINDGHIDDRGFEWDTNTGAPYTDNWTENGSWGVGEFTHGIVGLTEGELYYYRGFASNNTSADWGYGGEVTFLTKPDEPNSLTSSSANFSQVNLVWTLGAGADNTTIVAKQNSYPANRADGTAIYADTGTSVNHTGLSQGQHWYYRAWSWCAEGELEQWSDTYNEYNILLTLNAPTNFLITQVGTNSANITWTKDPLATTTIIRVSTQGYPATPTDGYLSYNGTGETILEEGLSLDTMNYYFRAWSWANPYSDDYAEGTIGGEAMILIALVLLAVGLTATLFLTRESMLGFPCVIMWAVLGSYAYVESSTPWGDWQFFLAFACLLGMTTFCGLAAFGLREKRDTLAEEEMDEEGEGESDKFIDEESEESSNTPESRRTRRRERAATRRTRASKRDVKSIKKTYKELGLS